MADHHQKMEVPPEELLSIAQAHRRLPHLSEPALRGKIREGIVPSVRIAGRVFVIESDLAHIFGFRFLPKPSTTRRRSSK